jgi:porin
MSALLINSFELFLLGSLLVCPSVLAEKSPRLLSVSQYSPFLLQITEASGFAPSETTWKYNRFCPFKLNPSLGCDCLRVDFFYSGEVFSKLRGGRENSRGSDYRGNLDLMLTFDLEKMGLLPGARFFIYGQNGHGRGITQSRVGGIQNLSNIEARDFIQVSEYWIEKEFAESGVRIKLGKQNANDDFEERRFSGDLLNDSFGATPIIPMPTFPDPGLGVSAFYEPGKYWSLGLAVYDGDSRGGKSGFETAFDGKGGAFSIVELTLMPSFGNDNSYPGNWRLGWWNHSGELATVVNTPTPKMLSGNYGFYLAADQLLVKESTDPENEQGLGGFLQYAWAPENRNEVSTYLGLGFAYTGLIGGRDEDITGLGLAHAGLSSHLEDIVGRTSETILEFFYKIQVIPCLAIQPDIQYVFNPVYGDTNALAFGLRLQLNP